nr:hypothetical protein [uncultured Rhodopila sp.]
MRRIEVPCTIEIEQTPEYLYAHTTPEGIDIGPGDRVLVHGAPSNIRFGDRITVMGTATVIRATAFGRIWAHAVGLMSLFELYDVGFEPKESL